MHPLHADPTAEEVWAKQQRAGLRGSPRRLATGLGDGPQERAARALCGERAATARGSRRWQHRASTLPASRDPACQHGLQPHPVRPAAQPHPARPAAPPCMQHAQCPKIVVQAMAHNERLCVNLPQEHGLQHGSISEGCLASPCVGRGSLRTTMFGLHAPSMLNKSCLQPVSFVS